MIDLDVYQEHAARTAHFRLWDNPESKADFHGWLASMALGVAGESGELLEKVQEAFGVSSPLAGVAAKATVHSARIADMVKKIIGHGHPLERHRAELSKELGDVLWYIAMVSALLGYNLSEIAELNIKKLAARYTQSDGSVSFSTEASVNRKPEDASGTEQMMQHLSERPAASVHGAACYQCHGAHHWMDCPENGCPLVNTSDDETRKTTEMKKVEA